MKRFKLLILVFFVAISIPLAFVIWQTYTGLEQEERGQLEFFSEALFDQMEKELAELVQEEENRAVDEYQYFLAQPFEREQSPQQLSPLAELVYEKYILGYLQNNPDGSFQTPLIADMGSIPENKQTVVLQLQEANRIFNNKKYSLPRQHESETTAEQKRAEDTTAKDNVKASFSERYLARSKTEAGKIYLGKKQQRVEEISAEQVFNVASEDESIGPSSQEATGISTPSSAATRRSDSVSKDDAVREQRKPSLADADLKEQNGPQNEAAVSVSQQMKFQVEVAPFQSVSIKDDQVYIFRRIAVNNQIYRQGFILLVEPFFEHLVSSHFIQQPLAGYTAIQLQRRDQGQKRNIVQAGVSGVSTSFIAERVFPAPFDFLSVTLRAAKIPPSPARGPLRIALVLLGMSLFLGLFAIYQSARTIVLMSERRSQFVSSVTHELKTPLTNIQMYIEMLEQGIAATPEREQEYLTILHSESRRLSGLINNVLELAKLEKKQRNFHMQEGQLTDVLTEVTRIMAEKLKQEGFTLEIQASEIPLISYDREVLIQVMINLIENSIKFGRKSTTRQIIIKLDTQDHHVQIAVSDSGPGIPRHALKKIFDDFYRVDNDLTRSTGGTGIGLALVKKFITAMGGSVYAVNNAGPGCTITLLLHS
ncbi:MAG: HAMP domain-containing histidine kinase [Deltaproteobacteria bacterium]|nr:HAMP domain-containing histidine kinase [Deltaproteobacteria bacterium]